MARFCLKCREPMRYGRRDVHVRCRISYALADDILEDLRLALDTPVKRLAKDFGVDYRTMIAALRMAQRRRTARLLATAA